MARPEIYTPEEKDSFLECLRAKFLDSNELQKKDIVAFAEAESKPFPNFIFNDPRRKLSHGQYYIGEILETTVPAADNDIPSVTADEISLPEAKAGYFIPDEDPTYIPFGFYENLKKIVTSGIFYPVYITGLSGNGKTLMVLQVCHALGREVIRVNITKDTDVFDLFGNYELVNGTTYWRDGPVLTAMKRGAVLLLDEIDYGTERILCLQGVLEGRSHLDKKRNVLVKPAPGFNIIATANTKGKGDNTGRFIGANIMNEAFLERFPLTVEQKYPDSEVETKIIMRNLEDLGIPDSPEIQQMTTDLVNWANQIRNTHENEGFEDVITTRRVVTIIRTYSIFRDFDVAMNLCIGRFDSDIKAALMDQFKKMRGGATVIPVKQKDDKISVSTVAAGSYRGVVPTRCHNDYQGIASKMSKNYRSRVIINEDNGLLVVVSHKYVTTAPMTDIPSVVNDSIRAQSKIIELLDLNLTAYEKSQKP